MEQCDHFVIFRRIAMPLSEDEKSRLDEIEAHVRATDPDFVQRLRTGATFRHPSMAPVAEPARVIEPTREVDPAPVDPDRRYHRRLILLSCLLFVSVSLLSNGLSAANGLISLGAVVAIIGGVLTGWTTLLLVRFRQGYRARPA
jgi:hypothetical protein